MPTFGSQTALSQRQMLAFVPQPNPAGLPIVNPLPLWREPVSDIPNCPKCGSAYAYEDRNLFICPECAHEWTTDETSESAEAALNVTDANGNPLKDGDSVTVIKDLKVKGSSLVVKVGTRVKNIRLVEGDHDIDCKIEGIGAMKLKSEFVKKS